MDISLRFILFIIGAIAIAAIYYDGKRRKSTPAQAKKQPQPLDKILAKETPDAQSDLQATINVDAVHTEEVVIESSATATYWGDNTQEPQTIISENITITEDARQEPLFDPDTVPPTPQNDLQSHLDEFSIEVMKKAEPTPDFDDNIHLRDQNFYVEKPEKILSINLIPKGFGQIGGEAIAHAAKMAGLDFERGYFVRYEAGDHDRPIQYHMVSSMEPGTIDLDQLDDYVTSGLTLFMVLPAPAKPLQAFESMLRNARELAVRLQLDLYDEHQNILSVQAIEYLRSVAREYERAALLKGA